MVTVKEPPPDAWAWVGVTVGFWTDAPGVAACFWPDAAGVAPPPPAAWVAPEPPQPAKAITAKSETRANLRISVLLDLAANGTCARLAGNCRPSIRTWL
jgi:hypothetical protein